MTRGAKCVGIRAEGVRGTPRSLVPARSGGGLSRGVGLVENESEDAEHRTAYDDTEVIEVMTTMKNFSNRARNMIRAASLLGAAAVLTLGVGGCADAKQFKQLKAEVGDLRTQNQQLDQSNRQLQEQVAMLQTTRASEPAGGTTMSRGAGNDVVITVAGDVLFASGQATLKPTAKTELNSVASKLNGEYSGHRVRIEGYTDSDPIRKSKWGSNEALSEARAQAVQEYLASKGVDSMRISSVGMGAAKPKGSKADSRRVEIVVVGNQ